MSLGATLMLVFGCVVLYGGLGCCLWRAAAARRERR